MRGLTRVFQTGVKYSRLYQKWPVYAAVAFYLTGGALFSLAAENYALVLGTNYKGKSPISDLNSPEKDAALIRDQLAATGEFSPSRIKVLLGEEVNRAQIQKEIDHFARIVTPKDQFFLFFSGHGAYYRNPDSKNRSEMSHFLVMFYRPHLSGEELNSWLKKVKARSSLVVVDACFSGGLAKPGQNVKGSSNIPIPEGSDAVVLQDMKSLSMNGRVVIASSDADETSIEAGPPIGQGVFTYHFSKAMVDGDLNNDGTLSAAEAFATARQNTVAMANRFHHRQTPQISGDGANWFFKKNSVSQATSESAPPTQESQSALPGETPSNSEPPPTEAPPVTGSIVISTNLRYDIIQNDTLRVSALGDDLTQGDLFQWKIHWVSDPHWGKVARITGSAPAGIYHVKIAAKGYPVQEFEIGILPGKNSQEEVLAAPSNRGAISGNVWVENFTQPFGGLKIFLEPVRSSRQGVVITDKKGAFVFPELLPGKYTVRIVGGMGYFTNPYNAEIEVKPGEVADIEVVLKESVKRGLPKKD